MKNQKSYHELSEFFYGFVKWIVRSCKECGVDQLYFFTREGEFFKKIYDQIKYYEPELATISAVNVLEVSRLATFAASLRNVEPEEFQRMWSQYNEQTLRTFFLSLGMEVDEFLPVIKKYNISVDEIIVNPIYDKRMRSLIADNLIKDALLTNAQSKKKILTQYCREHGIKDGTQVAIVDIGWRGTIQDNLCLILPHVVWRGYYLCLAPYLNEQPLNGSKKSFLNLNESKVVLRYPTPIEMICNSPNGSVVGYECIDGKIAAVKNISTKENDVYYFYTSNFQRKILEYIPRLVSSKNINTKKNALKTFLMYPPKEAAKNYFKLQHNESFGNGAFINKSVSVHWWLFLFASVSHNARIELKEELSKTTWPQGYMVRSRLKWLVYIYNYILEKKYL